MKAIIDRAESRGFADHGWLKTYHTFSFADYYNPQRMNFGALRVLNDDTVAPGKGFGTHPHKNMEVVTIPIKGTLKHGDSMENIETITYGEIQVMSAGTGIFHSEYNGSDSENVEFLQIWVLPKYENTPPEYTSYDIKKQLKKNHLSLIISPDGKTPASIKQDAWFSLGQLDAGKKFEYSFHANNTGTYLFIIEGKINIGNVNLARRDGIGIFDTQDFVFETQEKSHLLAIEVPMK